MYMKVLNVLTGQYSGGSDVISVNPKPGKSRFPLPKVSECVGGVRLKLIVESHKEWYTLRSIMKANYVRSVQVVEVVLEDVKLQYQASVSNR